MPTHTELIRCLVTAVLLAFGSGCADISDEPVDEIGSETPEAETDEQIPVPDVAGDGWDRDIVFIETDADTALHMTWHFRTREAGDAMVWERSFRLGGARGWESVLADTLASDAARVPWRVLPGGPVKLVVETDDALSSLIFVDGARQVELQLGEFLDEWSRPEGGSLRLFRGAGITEDLTEDQDDTEANGIVVDLTRAWAGDGGPPGDWILLQAGAGTQLFMEEIRRDGGPDPAETGAEEAGVAPDASDPTASDPTAPDASDPTAADARGVRFRGWSRVAFLAQPWPEIDVRWSETRSFERARRDIPVRWTFNSPGGEVEGEIEAVSSDLAAGPGDGPLLPVTAYFEVAGEIRIQGEAISVRGIVRHVQR